MELPTTTQTGFSDIDRQAALDDGSISKADEITREDEFDPVYDDFYGQPFLHHLRSRYCPYSIPPYFKCDHPHDDLFMDILGKSHLPRALEDEPVYVESLTKRAVVELIWIDTCMLKYIWNNKNMEHLYTTIIESAASLVYFLYPQTELYRIGRSRALDEELDQLWDQLQLQEVFQLQLQEDGPFDSVWALVNKLTSTNKYQLVTEEFIADMLYQPDFTRPRLKNPSFPVVAENDKDKLYEDIAKVVKDFKPPPLEPDEYTHWMMTFLRGDASDVELNIMSKTIDDRNKWPIQNRFHDPFYSVLHEVLINSKISLKEKLLNVVQPLIKICQPVRHEESCAIIEIVEVAELRRIAAGNQFIGRSHLIWAFYKLGYSLPLEFKNCIRVDVPDESHPPYHIYMAAAKLALMSGDKCAKLVHFIYAVSHSNSIGFDGMWLTETTYLYFGEFKKALEEMENEIEPKHTVTVRPCHAVDAIIQEMRERYNN